MNKKKTIIAAIILLLVFTVGGLIAYFTDTESRTNTFTIGNVNISLSEPSWSTVDSNDNGVPDAAENIVPGQTIPKNPTITNESNTNPAYVFMKVQVPCTTETSPRELFTYTPNSGWSELTTDTLPVACTSGASATHVYYYGSNNTLSELGVSTSATATTSALFDGVTLLNNLQGNEGLTGQKSVIVTGYGIQTQGLGSTTPADVWSNFS